MQESEDTTMLADGDSRSSEGDRPWAAKRGRRGVAPSQSQAVDASLAEAIKTLTKN